MENSEGEEEEWGGIQEKYEDVNEVQDEGQSGRADGLLHKKRALLKAKVCFRLCLYYVAHLP